MQIDIFRIFCILYFLWFMSNSGTYGKWLGSELYTWNEWDTLSELKLLQLSKKKKNFTWILVT